MAITLQRKSTRNLIKLLAGLILVSLFLTPLFIMANTVDVNRARNLENVEVSPFSPRYNYETMKITFDQKSGLLDAQSQQALIDKILDLNYSKELDQGLLPATQMSRTQVEIKLLLARRIVS